MMSYLVIDDDIDAHNGKVDDDEIVPGESSHPDSDHPQMNANICMQHITTIYSQMPSNYQAVNCSQQFMQHKFSFSTDFNVEAML